ncbi:MAG: hypothetical protein IPK98_06750 [Chloracidobacterium sp.]|nr:hypothetical protein [Chloracidobacterium sp.]
MIKLDFTSPILTSGSAITRYVDKEDGAEYIYSLFVPSDASTAFPVFDQPDLKARFTVQISTPRGLVCCFKYLLFLQMNGSNIGREDKEAPSEPNKVTLVNWWTIDWSFQETKPISTYSSHSRPGRLGVRTKAETGAVARRPRVPSNEAPSWSGFRLDDALSSHLRSKSQAKKFEPHSKRSFGLMRRHKISRNLFRLQIPFPKYDLGLIPEVSVWRDGARGSDFFA